MATITSKKIVDDIIDGYYADDEPTQIVEYVDVGGKTVWGVTFGNDEKDSYLSCSEYIRNPKIIWDSENGKR